MFVSAWNLVLLCPTELCPLPSPHVNLYTHRHTNMHPHTQREPITGLETHKQTWVSTPFTSSHQYLTQALRYTLSIDIHVETHTRRHTDVSSCSSLLCVSAALSCMDCSASICSRFVTADSVKTRSPKSNLTLSSTMGMCLVSTCQNGYKSSDTHNRLSLLYFFPRAWRLWWPNALIIIGFPPWREAHREIYHHVA